MHWEAKKFVWLTSLQYLLYRGGLELNLQYFWGLPVVQNAGSGKKLCHLGKLLKCSVPGFSHWLNENETIYLNKYVH